MAAKAAPKFEFGKVDFEQMLTLHKANLATMFETQRVVLDAAQTLAAAQFNYVRDVLGNAETMVSKLDPQAKPEAYAEDAKVAAEKAMAVAKNGYELGLKAQNDVAELWNKRVNANVEEFKKFAA
ncbi:MAG: phasin family protein [Pseudomonadota bacterium]